VKPCPFCEAELRDSVIRCTRCGRSLIGEPEPEDARTPARAGAGPVLGAPVVSPGTRGTSIGFPAPDPSTPPTPAWATTAARPAGPPAPPSTLAARRALPIDRRSGGPDLALLFAAVVAAAAAVWAWTSIAEPWVRLVITDTSERLDPRLVGEVSLQGEAALLGVIGRALVVALGVYALAWLVYGFDRGTTIPWLANPAVSILIALAGLFATVLSATVWFVWEDAAVEHARAVKMSAEELQALLDLQPAPLVEIERLTGLMTFGGAMVVALVAACIAWWAARKRG
jgi:hypothetical protein